MTAKVQLNFKNPESHRFGSGSYQLGKIEDVERGDAINIFWAFLVKNGTHLKKNQNL